MTEESVNNHINDAQIHRRRQNEMTVCLG